MRTNRFFGVICHLTLSHLQWKVVTRLLFVFSLHMFSTSAFQIEPLQSEGVCQDHITHFMTTFALAGEPVVLKCPTVRYLLINNHPLDLNLTWQKNGSAIMPAGYEETTRVFLEGDSVWFLPASLGDSGDYTCIRSNSTYCVELSIQLAILESAVEDIFYPQMVFTLKSDKVVCPALEDFTQNNEDYELKWYKDGAHLDIDSKKFKVLRGTNYLIINNVSTEDSGYYTCQMTFEHEAEQYNITRIIELETIARKEKSNPVIVSPYQKITLAALGSQLTIPCKVFVGTSSSSHTDVWWEANRSYIGAIYPNGRVREGQRQEFVENNENYIEVPLIFDPVNEEDFSTDFRCAVHNGAAFQMRPTQVRQEEIGLPLYLAVIPVAIAAVIVGGICIHKYSKQRSARGYNAAKSKEQNPLFL